MKRETMMLAHSYKNSIIGGCLESEKLDGMRCMWDGGITRGLPKAGVPWANTSKDARYQIKPIATGLWSRYWNVIHAPDWFLDQLPKDIPFDGELWVGRNSRQKLMSTVKKLVPVDSEWEQVKYMVFDCPSYEAMFHDGIIKIGDHTITLDDVVHFAYQNMRSLNPPAFSTRPTTRFDVAQKILEKLLPHDGDTRNIHRVVQTQLPYQQAEAEHCMTSSMDAVTALGGEGLMLRAPGSPWVAERSHMLLKVKKRQDAEAVITGFTAGRETDKGSRLLGKIGALITEYDGMRLELSGMTDEEREFSEYEFALVARAYPGIDMAGYTQGKHFRVGEVVTFRYRGLSKDGVPQEAAYWRKRDDNA